jgi:3-hydroxyisobutyrate dehydrogenase-like beta-hydroxyacid dehydrogenase
MTATIGFVGLGTMGHGMAHRLLSCGRSLQVYNRTPQRADDLRQAGARVCPTPRAAALGAHVVFISVADAVALRSVSDGPDGVLSAVRPDAIVVNMSTVAPEDVRDLARKAARRGVRTLDAGVLGNGAQACQGALRAYVGGDAAVLAACRPWLDDLAKEVVHVGPLGAGMQLKLALNLVMGLEMQAMAEAVAFADSLGLDRARVLDAIAGGGFGSPVMKFKARRMAAKAYGDPDFRLALMAKDLGLVAEQALTRGVEMPMTEAARRRHEDAVAADLGGLDCAAILELYSG